MKVILTLVIQMSQTLLMVVIMLSMILLGAIMLSAIQLSVYLMLVIHYVLIVTCHSAECQDAQSSVKRIINACFVSRTSKDL